MTVSPSGIAATRTRLWASNDESPPDHSLDDFAQRHGPAFHFSLALDPFGRREQGLHQVMQSMAGIPKAVQQGVSGSGHQLVPLEGARDTFDDRERGPEFVRNGGYDGGFPKGQIALLVRQTKLSISLPTKASGGGGDDTEQRDIQKGQATQEHQIQPLTIPCHRGLDRQVWKVEFERSRRCRITREDQGNVHLEQLPIAPVADVLLLGEIGHLGDDLAVQSILELMGGGKSATDELGVV